jgi:hypothetical protein
MLSASLWQTSKKFAEAEKAAKTTMLSDKLLRSYSPHQSDASANLTAPKPRAAPAVRRISLGDLRRRDDVQILAVPRRGG